MRSVRIYFEGEDRLRRGFRKFFGDDRGIKLVAGGNTSETEKRFLEGEKDYPDCLVLLLIDSDGPLTDEPRHPRRFFMVQIMESWFPADREALAEYFGKNFKTSALPGSPTAIESIPKKDVEDALDNVTRQCQKLEYRRNKVGYGSDLLSRISAMKVRKASLECNRLFQALGL